MSANTDPRLIYGYPIARLSIVDTLTPKTPPELKKLWIAYVLWIPPLGIFGAHHFYLGRTTFGAIYAAFFGNLFIGWLFDFFRMKQLVQRRNEELWMLNNHDVQEIIEQVRYVDDCYLLQFPFGLFGLVQFYLDRASTGCFYIVTLGGFLFLWVYDYYRMPRLVHEKNSEISGYDAYVVKLERMRGGFIDSASHRPSVDPRPSDRPRMRHSASRGSIGPPGPDGAPPSYEDVLNRGNTTYPIVRSGQDNEGFEREDTLEDITEEVHGEETREDEGETGVQVQIEHQEESSQEEEQETSTTNTADSAL